MGLLPKGWEWVNLAPEGPASFVDAEGGGAVPPLAGRGGAEVVEVALVGGAEAALGGGAAGANDMRERPGRRDQHRVVTNLGYWIPGTSGLPRMCEGTERRGGSSPKFCRRETEPEVSSEERKLPEQKMAENNGRELTSHGKRYFCDVEPPCPGDPFPSVRLWPLEPVHEAQYRRSTERVNGRRA
jgi:hypothetical protein